MSPLKTLLPSATALGIATIATAQTQPPAPAGAQTPVATQPAAAPTGGKVVPGATVLDPSGGQVGTIKSVDPQGAVLSTGTNEVRLPLASFAAGANGPVISMTKAQLDEAAGQAAAGAKANLAAQLAVGSKIKDPQGGDVGTVAENDGQFVTVSTAKNKVKLPLNAFAGGPNGAVIGMTATQLDAEAAKAVAAPAK